MVWVTVALNNIKKCAKTHALLKSDDWKKKSPQTFKHTIVCLYQLETATRSSVAQRNRCTRKKWYHVHIDWLLLIHLVYFRDRFLKRLSTSSNYPSATHLRFEQQDARLHLDELMPVRQFAPTRKQNDSSEPSRIRTDASAYSIRSTITKNYLYHCHLHQFLLSDRPAHSSYLTYVQFCI